MDNEPFINVHSKTPTLTLGIWELPSHVSRFKIEPAGTPKEFLARSPKIPFEFWPFMYVNYKSVVTAFMD
jgi:hypothetical protein